MDSRILEIPAGSDAGTQIPLTTIHGARPGPVLALIAGNHGYEYPPILALQRLRGVIDPAALSGTVLMVHVANMPSFLGAPCTSARSTEKISIAFIPAAPMAP